MRTICALALKFTATVAILVPVSCTGSESTGADSGNGNPTGGTTGGTSATDVSASGGSGANTGSGGSPVGPGSTATGGDTSIMTTGGASTGLGGTTTTAGLGGTTTTASSGGTTTTGNSGGATTSAGSGGRGARGATGGAGGNPATGGRTGAAAGTSSGGASGGAGTAGGGAATGGSGSGGAAVTDGSLFSEQHQLASDVDPSAPGTIGIVTWSVNVDSITSARIEFGLDTGYGAIAPVDLSQPDFRTLLLGMKPDHSYHFRIVASDGATDYASDDYVIETGPATNLVNLGAFDVRNEGARERGFMVTSYWQGRGGQNASVAFVIDADGDIVWWYDSSVDGIARARMSEDGKNMWIIAADPSRGHPLERVTMDALDGETYSAALGSHDLTPVSGATMAFLEYGETDCDSIFEIDPSGNTKEVFESSDYVNAGGCHGNALRYSKKEDVYTFSDVSQDVFIVNRSGGVEWRLSEKVSGGNSAWGGSQHGHHLLDSSILVYANRASGNTSAVFEYSLDGQELHKFSGGGSTANLGDVQRLPGGNTLVTHSNDSIIEEFDAQGNVVLHIDGGGSSLGYTVWRESLYGPPPDIGL
ncbi:MAG: hypothetical protein JW940_16180 [Polyangiaceae bacterium]|nr:hypothetical protein [Polyangiaceae bacterium]